jgi:hypothetical protein
MIFLINSSLQKTATRENISSFQPKWVNLRILFSNQTKAKGQTKKLRQTTNKKATTGLPLMKRIYFIAI